ncbi:MAG: helix-turn-helix transcriptional regulator [Fervidobacterium sp.]|uniref:helix-turn-helix transcriptional regulator n=1 Tax=Fervidobacterium sp. TaxID=1871331 RepID=UPI0025BEFF40|nr:helix-turn-helix transcriptional regulator [Fervidobacterium sp.]NPU90225.1 helix-turn-helix transcriptional regulator [Fervidobacterium sp.]
MRQDELGKLIRAKRIEKGMSQVKLANTSGVSRYTVILAESGHTNLTLKTLQEIANTLGYRVVIDLVPNEQEQ